MRAGAQTFDPNQKGGASFIRNTSKYWVHTRDVLKVKMFVLRNRPIYKFTDGPGDADLVTSIYFDNEALDLYEGRLKKLPGAIAFRIRWYGATEAPPLVFIERKTHQARPARPEPVPSPHPPALPAHTQERRGGCHFASRRKGTTRTTARRRSSPTGGATLPGGRCCLRSIA